MVKFLFVSAIAALGTVVLGLPGDVLDTTDSFLGFVRGNGGDSFDPVMSMTTEYLPDTKKVVLDMNIRSNRGRRIVDDRFMNFALGVVSSELYCGNSKSGSDCIPEPTQANQNQSPWNIADDKSALNGKIAAYMASKYLFVSNRYSDSDRIGTCRVLLVDPLCSNFQGCEEVVDSSGQPVRGNNGFRLAKGVAVANGKFTDVTDQVTIEATRFSKTTFQTEMDVKITFNANLFGGANSPFQFAKAEKTYLTWAQWYKQVDNREECDASNAVIDYQAERDVKQVLPNSDSRRDGFSVNIFTTEPPTSAPTPSPVPTPPPVPTRSPTTGSPTKSPTLLPTASPVQLPCPEQLKWYSCGIINSWWPHIQKPSQREKKIRNRCRNTRGCAYCNTGDPNKQNCQPRVGEDGSQMKVADVCAGNTPGAAFEEPRCQQFNECPKPEEMSACRIFNQKHTGFQRRKCQRGFTVNLNGERFTAGPRRCAWGNGICRAVGPWFPQRKGIVKLPGLFDKIRDCPFDARDPQA